MSNETKELICSPANIKQFKKLESDSTVNRVKIAAKLFLADYNV